MLNRLAGAFAVLSLATCVAANAADDCQLKRLSSLDLKVEPGGRVEVPAIIAGHPISLLVDTGSNHTMLTEGIVSELGLQKELFAESAVSMWGGQRVTKYVNVDGMQLGRLVVGLSQFFILPEPHGAGTDGLLGSDIMSRFDADFDFASAKLNLFSRNHCRGKVVYWTDDTQYAIVPFRKSPGYAAARGIDFKKVMLTVTIDGREFQAGLDTGASFNSMNLDEAKSEFGLTPDSPGMVPVHRPSGTAYRYRFKTMSFGGVAVNDPEIELDPYAVNKMPGVAPTVLVGMPVLRQLHLYVAYEEEKLYVSAAGAH